MLQGAGIAAGEAGAGLQVLVAGRCNEKTKSGL